MGHEVRYWDFPVETSKETILEEINDMCRYASDDRSNLPYEITFHSHCFNSREEAKAFIQSIDKEYNQIAVKYKVVENFKPSKAFEALKAKLFTARKAYNELNSKFHFENHTATTVGCKNCGSKLALSYLKGNKCPLCNRDLRPESTLQRIEALKQKTEALEEKLDVMKKTEYAKQLSKAVDYWLIKTEWHV